MDEQEESRKRADAIIAQLTKSNTALNERLRELEAIRRAGRDLIGLYRVTLPETNPKIFSIKRMLEMVSAPFPTTGGYPTVGEQAVLDSHVASLEDDVGDYSYNGWGADVDESY